MITGSGCAAADAHRIFNFTVNSARVPDSSHSFDTLSPPRLEADSEDGLNLDQAPPSAGKVQDLAAGRGGAGAVAADGIGTRVAHCASTGEFRNAREAAYHHIQKIAEALGANPLLRRRAGRAATTDALEQEKEGDASPLRPRLTPKAATCAYKAPTINSL
eukprot:NODE_4524_length_1881_cov_5.908780.p2 GENE.NODE_4524_length_1881_cov_5.908780~~NODE_4524_length_1881_cov_5.908780.p2  ORF type:complete len:161 (+),score=17.86 NODE_4524_length_1881_cov_5.908780:1026-1508(+)